VSSKRKTELHTSAIRVYNDTIAKHPIMMLQCSCYRRDNVEKPSLVFVV
jgi:hypothetical protein